MHLIENDFLRIAVQERGAELVSVFDKKNNIEHLWQAEPNIWGRHAPVLFPVIGRCWRDEISMDGQNFKMLQHGFARDIKFSLVDITATSMVFSLKNNEWSEKIYPYKFELLISYRLEGSLLVVAYEVKNNDEGNIYFQLGAHPGFAVPFGTRGQYDDYYLEFEHIENANRYFLDGNGFFNGRKELFLANSNIINLRADLFSNDALIFKNLKSRKVIIKSKTHEHYLSVDFTNFNYLGVWAKPGAKFVCIEPWLGCADTAGKPTEFKDKEGIIKLASGASFDASFKIGIG